MSDNTAWHWRYTMRPVRFFGLDARAVFPFCLLLVYARLITLLFCIASTIAFRVLEKRGLTVPSAVRAFRVWVVGNQRPSLLGIHKRKFNDFG